MTVTYVGSDIYEVVLSHPEHPIEQTFSMRKQDVLDLLEKVDHLDYFTDEDFPFFDFICPTGGC